METLELEINGLGTITPLKPRIVTSSGSLRALSTSIYPSERSRLPQTVLSSGRWLKGTQRPISWIKGLTMTEPKSRPTDRAPSSDRRLFVVVAAAVVAFTGVLLVAGQMAFPRIADATVPTPGTALMSSYKQVVELEGADTVAGDGFGHAVAAWGDSVVVGAPDHGSQGRANVFSKASARWRRDAELEGSGIVTNSGFGCSAGISGSTIVIGALGQADNAGRAYVFHKTATGWKQAAELKGSDTIADDFFGGSVAISGTTIVVGALGHRMGAGRAYVFHKTATGWKQVAELKGSDTIADDFFGSSVAISDQTIAVGAYQKDSEGRAYVFAKKPTSWRQVAELKGSDTVARDDFGFSVAVSRNTIVVGALAHAAQTGRAYVFRGTAAGWFQVAELKGSRTSSGGLVRRRRYFWHHYRGRGACR